MASKLLRNGTVLAYDEASEQIDVRRGASIWIVDDHIEAIVDNADELDLPTDTEIIDVTGKIVSPGFVNTHIHSWQSVFRTLGPNVNLIHYMPWFGQFGHGASKFTGEDMYISSLQCWLEGLNGGVTSYIDHAHNSSNGELARPYFEACIDSGARIWWCYDPIPSKTTSLDAQWKVLESLVPHKDDAGLVSLGVAFDSLCWVSEDELKKAKEKMKALDVQHVTVHHLGGPWPTPKSTPEHFSSAYALHDIDIPVTYSHAGYLTAADMTALRKHDTFISITPESEFHYGQGQATGHLIQDQASIGVDTQFTFSQDILNQMRIWLQAVRNQGYRKCLDAGYLPRDVPMQVEDAFLLGTLQGGRALHRDDIGLLKPGAKADVVVFDGSSPNMLGWHDPIAAVVLHANVSDIQHVLVNGEFRKKDFKLVCKKHDLEHIKKEFLKSCERLQPFVVDPPSKPEGLFGQGTMGDVEIVSLKKSREQARTQR